MGQRRCCAADDTDDGQGHPFDLTLSSGAHYLYTINRTNGYLDTLGSELVAHQLSAATPSMGLPSSEPVGTGASTASSGTNTVTNAAGGVSTSSFTVASTAGFTEIPGRIYITVGPQPALPESPISVALPVAGVGILGFGFVVMRRRKATA